jgi:hypothetical protein
MAHKRKKLHDYIYSRQKKYHRPYKILCHISCAPRNFILPHRTTWNPYEYDGEREQALVFLTPFTYLKKWFDWATSKFHGSESTHNYKRLFNHGYVVLYVHLVRVPMKDIIIPKLRFLNELAIAKAIRPLAIVPVRYYFYQKINLAKVASMMKRLKQYPGKM